MFFARTLRAAAVGAVGLGLLLFSGGAASAHVTVSPANTASGGYSTLTFAFSHGCGESPTERIAIQIPEGIFSAAPEVPAGWSVEKVMEKLDEPADDGHGGQYTERVDQVVFTADEPVANGFLARMAISLKLPELEPGTLLEFPTVQGCTEGETAWVQSSVGVDEEPESPAPGFEITAASGDGHGSSEGGDDHSGDEGTTESSSEADLGSTPAVAWVGAVAGVIGLLLGGAALASSRRRS